MALVLLLATMGLSVGVAAAILAGVLFLMKNSPVMAARSPIGDAVTK